MRHPSRSRLMVTLVDRTTDLAVLLSVRAMAAYAVCTCFRCPLSPLVAGCSLEIQRVCSLLYPGGSPALIGVDVMRPWGTCYALAMFRTKGGCQAACAVNFWNIYGTLRSCLSDEMHWHHLTIMTFLFVFECIMGKRMLLHMKLSNLKECLSELHSE
jgi:hypothetical protein